MELGTLDWAGIGALLLAFATIWKALRETPKSVEKVEAETTDKYVEIANKSADLLSYHLGRNAALREELDIACTKLEIYDDGVIVLLKQLRELGAEPEWTPPE
jgi:hypothetical protein